MCDCGVMLLCVCFCVCVVMTSRSFYVYLYGLRIHSCFAHSACRRMLVLVLDPPSLSVVVVILCVVITRISGCDGHISAFMCCRKSMSGIVGDAVVGVCRCGVFLNRLGSGRGRFFVFARAPVSVSFPLLRSNVSVFDALPSSLLAGAPVRLLCYKEDSSNTCHCIVGRA